MRYVGLALVILIIVIIAVLAVRVIVRPPSAVTHPWPAGLGTLEDFPRRHPAQAMSSGAETLISLARPLEIELRPGVPDRPAVPLFRDLTDYINRSVERTDTGTIDAPPASVTEMLAGHAADIERIRRHLLSGAPVVWAFDPRSGPDQAPANLIGNLRLQRVLCASALDRARRGDRGAWDDLHAAWRIDEPLWRRIDVTSVLIALHGARTIGALAVKMPAPEAPWIAEIQRLDARQAMLATMQADAWRTWLRASSPIRGVTARSVDKEREMAEWLATYADCSFEKSTFEQGWSYYVSGSRGGLHLPSLTSAWQRTFRYNAERELTERVFAARRGAPPEPQSKACIDGRWEYEEGDDRALTIRYQGVIQPVEKGETAYPLEMTIR